MHRRLAHVLLATTTTALVALGLPAAAAPHAPPSIGATLSAGALPDPHFGASAREDALAHAQTQAAAVAKELGLGRAESLDAADVERDADGTEHLHYDRTYAGMPVVGGDLIVHTSPSGRTVGVDATTEGPIRGVATKAAVGADDAADTVARHVGVANGSVGDATLVVWAVRSVPRLAWQLEVHGTDAAGGPVRRVAYVDAATGAYIAGWSELETVTGSGQSLYSGKVPVQSVKTKHGYKLKDTTRGNAITVDVKNQKDPKNDYLKGTIFSDKDNRWGNGLPTNRQSAAVDAAYGVAKTWDFYKSMFGRQGIRGDGVGAKSRVHYATGLDNAFWDDNCFCMTYGDGGESFKTVVGLDVAGHEMTHGVTSHTAGLLYLGESGGLNEANSDIFGTMVEFSAANPKDPGDYYIGENIVKPTYGAPSLRRMDQPSSDGGSYDCWTYGMGTDDVHYTSGVGNHFFYLLSEGTGPRTIGGLPHNGIACDGSSFSGIGRDTAVRIWYRSLTSYLTSASGYIEARDATIQAARDLYPSTPATCDAVVRAWDAVGVPQGYWTCAGPLDEGLSTLGVNPGFESGPTGWTVGGTTSITQDLSTGFPRSGTTWANFNALGTTNTSTLSRTVTVPNTATAELRFYMLVWTEDNPFEEYDTFDVLVNGTPLGDVAHWSNLSADNTYVRWDVPMGAYAGQTVDLQFVGQEDSGLATQFLLDDVTLTPR